MIHIELFNKLNKKHYQTFYLFGSVFYITLVNYGRVYN